jgi:NAD(P)-dependent dehydrogenase (short-subunit alcohol dehydrogenase family)
MGALDGRVAIITGAGGGLGREHALLFAREGAHVVVNDLGGDVRGEGADRAPAQLVVDEIVAAGGVAVANTDSVTDWEGSERLVNQAVETFGGLHVLVNNAGILRDRVIVNMTEAEWDAVVQVHLKGHFCTTHHAAAYWRAQSKAGAEVKASIVHTSSTSGILGKSGQSNYGAAKAAIAAFSTICALELENYGVRSNAITPVARTRMTADLPVAGDRMRAPDDPSEFDYYHPANVSPLVGYLATADCPINGEIFLAVGDVVARYQPHVAMERIVNDGQRWTIDRLQDAATSLVPTDRRGGATEIDFARK